MKIAIASYGESEDSEVSSVVGRAHYFLIYEDKKLVKVIKNPFAIGGGGAGFAVAKMLADEGVKKIVAGHFGENMLGALEERGIKKEELYDLSVEEVLKRVQ